ncbi:thioredoxin [Candidatus Phytoplasma solani]|uniref:Thioredoxin n=2 Tax=Candidatus Phytoplasma solani TaxID=69896 RepID=A0A421NXK4_9MOLU|nr:thioredoxin [Candidatus Phytoplasma solani]RMI88674.1 thioredoxin [Candidatus Phytoplasma solani]CCP88154.1 Thioredoxin [Candidatus Phytoplasma solani]
MSTNKIINYQGQDFKDFINQKGLVLVDFFANWCGPCRKLAPILNELSQSEQGVVIAKVDIDEFRQLAIDHQVTHFPTLVLYKNQQEVARQVGFLEKPALLSFLKAHK